MTQRTKAERYQQDLKAASPGKMWNYGRSFQVHLEVTGVEATTYYILIDRSDITNFPHPIEGPIIIDRIVLNAEEPTAGVFEINFGVIVENDGTNGTVHNFIGRLNDTNPHDMICDPPAGINLEIASSKPVWVLTNIIDADNVIWKNDETLTSPAGAATPPGVGDLVMSVVEVSGAGVFDFSVLVEYSIG